MSPLILLPDVERVVALHLATVDELVDVTGPARVFTATPKDVGATPFVLVRRIGGDPAVGRPLVLDTGGLQVDCYGGTKRAAHTLARIVQAVLADLEGTVDDGMFVGNVTGTTLGPLRYLPDEAFAPARPRYVLDADVFVKRGRPSGGPAAPAAAVTAA